MPTRDSRLLFLPGASGNVHFWQPVASLLGPARDVVFQSYPGFGGVPADSSVNGMSDLLQRVLSQITAATDIVAQSMGGILAIRAALTRPQLVRSLVLTATSGGLDTRALGALDWRASFVSSFPGLPDWFVQERADLTALLPMLQLPVLLIWGDADPISPLAVGQKLLSLLPNAKLVVIEGGDHDVAQSHAEQVATHVRAHLASLH